jgi:hypothetical protein
MQISLLESIDTLEAVLMLIRQPVEPGLGGVDTPDALCNVQPCMDSSVLVPTCTCTYHGTPSGQLKKAFLSRHACSTAPWLHHGVARNSHCWACN